MVTGVKFIDEAPPATKGVKFLDEQKQEPTVLERAKRVGEETLTGGVFGAVAPEMMQATGGAIRQTAGRLPGVLGRAGTVGGAALEAGGKAMERSRPASFFTGTVAGAGGETAGQIYESKYGPGLDAEMVRLLGATLTPCLLSF